MRVRGMLLTTALLSSVALLPPSFAEDVEDEEVCLLVKDTLNDTVIQDTEGTNGVLVQRDIDITSADVSTSDDQLYAVVRVQDLAARPPTTYAQGRTTYRLEFGAGKRRFYVQVPTGYGTLNTTAYSWPYGATGGRVGGRPYHVWSQVDMFANEVTFRAPLSVFGRGSIKPGTVLTDYAVSAVRTFTDNGQLAPGVSSKVTISDSAVSKALYDADAPSCITPVEEPADEPVTEPAPEPTSAPSAEPSAAPSEEPTPAEPTEQPAEPAPSEEPTEWPTADPGTEPTAEPQPEPDPSSPPDESTEPEPTPAPSSQPEEPMSSPIG